MFAVVADEAEDKEYRQVMDYHHCLVLPILVGIVKAVQQESIYHDGNAHKSNSPKTTTGAPPTMRPYSIEGTCTSPMSLDKKHAPCRRET